MADRPSPLRPQLDQPQRVPWRRRVRYYLPAVATAAMATAVVVILVDAADPVVPEISFKGKLTVQVMGKRGERQFVVNDGQRLRAGDALRFTITTDSPGYLTVFSIDGKGEPSPCYPGTDPEINPTPLSVDAAGQRTLPGSVILDDSPGPEHMIIVFSPEPFDRTVVHRRVHGLVRHGLAPATLDARAARVNGAVYVISVGKESAS